MTTTPTTLADVSIAIARCSSCSRELPQSAPIETYWTPAGDWIVVECPECKCCTPFRLEEKHG